VDEADRVVLLGNVSPRLRAGRDLGRTDPNLPLRRMVLTLALRPGGREELRGMLAAVHDPASPLYHQWLTPQEFGSRFGAGDEAVQAVAGWLAGHGFTIDEIASGRGWINFSGNVRQVEQAFATEMHDVLADGVLHHANAIEPSIPRALAGIVQGVVALHDFRHQPLVHRRGPVPAGATRTGAGRVVPEAGFGGANYLAPADFATIYDLGSVYAGGLTGAGQAIAIAARTDIQLSDVETFRSSFGLPPRDPIVVHNGPPPGDLGGNDETEADLDTEWSGAIAPAATVYLVISASTVTDGADLSAQYIVDNNLAPVMSSSFGECEANLGSSGLAFYASLWQQAAMQGITALVASGDAGAAGCNAGSDTLGSGRAVSGLCTTPDNLCVGGTELMDTANPAQYWAATNDPVTQGSALSYIPEMAWNESGNVGGGAGLWSTGGGESGIYTKPPWQVAPGVPADGMRDVPDVALTAAAHDGYLVVQSGSLELVSGTSASSPAFAALISLAVQQTGARQGNANTVLYPLAANQYGSSGAAAFHDVATGNNSVPGVTGFNAGPGYDQATGLGSVDAAVLLANWGGGTAGCLAPAAPSGLAAAAAGPAAIRLTWNAVPGATSYLVLRSTAGGAGPYSLAGIVSTASFTDSGLGCGITYDYQVAATNGVCSSANGGAATAATAACGGGGCATLYSNSFESGSGLSDWTAGSFVTGSSLADWRGIQACLAHSGAHVFRFGGATCAASYGANDFLFAQPRGATGIAVPASVTATRLSFWHTWDFESGYDGGSLAVALDGNPYYYVPATAILAGPSYNGSIAGTCAPQGAAGAPVFTGSQASFANTVVDLDAACAAAGATAGCAGHSVHVAFTAITDCDTAGTGWSLDDVTVTACPAPLRFYTLPPCRVFDTRQTAALAGNSTTLFQVSGQCGVPASAVVVSANLTVVLPQSAGFITVYPGDGTQPGTSTLNFNSGQVRANNALVTLAGNGSGTIRVYTGIPTGTTNLLLDVNGYFQ
jgi:hypothetical protein